MEGKERAKINAFTETETHFRVEVEPIPEVAETDPNIAEVMANIKALFEEYVKLNKSIPPEMLLSISSIENPSRLADTLVAQLNIKLVERQKLLEQGDPLQRIATLEKFIQSEIEILQVEKKKRSLSIGEETRTDGSGS